MKCFKNMALMLSMIQEMMSLVVMCTTSQLHSYSYSVYGRSYQCESRDVFGRKQDAEEDTTLQVLCEIEQQLKQSVTIRVGEEC